MNKVIFTGRIAQVPEFKTTQSGLAYCKISIAVDSNMPNKQTGKKETYFFNGISWGKQAEFVNSYLIKGQLVCLTGELKNRSWQNQDGTKGFTTEISIDTIESLEKRPSFQTENTQTSGGVTVAPNPYAEDTTDYDPFANGE